MQTEVHFFLSAFLLDPILFPLNILAKSGKNNMKKKPFIFLGFKHPVTMFIVHSLTASFFWEEGIKRKVDQ